MNECSYCKDYKSIDDMCYYTVWSSVLKRFLKKHICLDCMSKYRYESQSNEN